MPDDTSAQNDRRFSEEEVALIIKRAAELQQTEAVAQEPSTALTLRDVEEIAKEAGIEPALVRRAAHSLDQHTEVTRPSPWVGAPTRLVYERVVDAEIPVDAYETLVNEIRRTIGDNGVPSVLGRTLAWTSTSRGGRRNSRGRQVDVSVVSRGGVTTIRVEEELRNIAGALFGGLVGGGGGGTTGITMGIGMGVFHSAPIAALLWVAVAGGFYTLARTIFANITAKREQQLEGLIGRLEEEVLELSKGKS
ncbi:MAG TPA: hypothetical protein VKO87_08410 [Gemmatimonadaceae bacterium]|nr:hypothetical protein [Gemmatimonadaceae bacterium]